MDLKDFYAGVTWQRMLFDIAIHYAVNQGAAPHLVNKVGFKTLRTLGSSVGTSLASALPDAKT